MVLLSFCLVGAPTAVQMWAIVDRSAEFTLAALFDSEDSVYRGRTDLTFEEFGQWYNAGGFKSVPWMELVDLSK